MSQPHVPSALLEAGLDHIRQSPADDGVLELIVRRPAVDQRDVLDTGDLDPAVGLVGDNWLARGSSSTPDGSAHPDGQLTVMNYRSAVLVAGSSDRVPLAGDQLFVDLDLSDARLPAGSRLAVGEAIVEITAKPHRGCEKFAARYGVAALRFVNVGAGRELNLRGRNARVVVGGTIRRGDRVHRLPGWPRLETAEVGLHTAEPAGSFSQPACTARRPALQLQIGARARRLLPMEIRGAEDMSRSEIVVVRPGGLIPIGSRKLAREKVGPVRPSRRRRPPPAIGAPMERTMSPSSIASSAASAFGHSDIPAPPSRTSGWRSNTVTSRPRRWRATARVSPPMPPPAIATPVTSPACRPSPGASNQPVAE